MFCERNEHRRLKVIVRFHGFRSLFVTERRLGLCREIEDLGTQVHNIANGVSAELQACGPSDRASLIARVNPEQTWLIRAVRLMKSTCPAISDIDGIVVQICNAAQELLSILTDYQNAELKLKIKFQDLMKRQYLKCACFVLSFGQK